MYDTFKSWDELLTFVRSGGWLFYHAPLDMRPTSVRVVKVFKNRKIRIDPGTRDADSFTADEDHLDRFRRQKK